VLPLSKHQLSSLLLLLHSQLLGQPLLRNRSLLHSNQLSQHQANLSQCSHSQAGQWAQCHPSRV
jgi:hypothetical protein